METLKEISKKSDILSIRDQFLKHIFDNYQNRVFTIDYLMNDKVIKDFIESNKSVKIKSKSVPKVSNEIRQTKPINKDNCQCRLWKNSGYDNIQCSRKKKDGTDFCGGKKHNTDWWLGLITEPRPEEPIGGKKMTRHYWSDQLKSKKSKKNNKDPSDTNSVEKVKKSKRKVKKEVPVHIVHELEDNPEGSDVDEIPSSNSVKDIDIVKPDMIDVSDKADSESDEDEPIKDIDYDGIIYKILTNDNMILDRRTGRPLGHLLKDGTIDFFSDDERSFHLKNKE